MYIIMVEDEILELSLDTFLTVYREDEFPLELAKHLTLEQCESLIPNGPGGWRKTSAVLQCLLRNVSLKFTLIILLKNLKYFVLMFVSLKYFQSHL